jgi:hypothetical protein
MVYFDPSSGTRVVSSPVCSLTSFQDVPASELAPFCPRAKAISELVVAEAIVTAANVNSTRIIIVLITAPVSAKGRRGECD